MQTTFKAGLVCCSDPLSIQSKPQIDLLIEVLETSGLHAESSRLIYTAASPKQKAQELMRIYRDPDIRMIFDLSGGDLANTLLPFLDFERIRRSGTSFWGYSDLTVILNAIFARTGQSSVLYRIRNLTDSSAAIQQSSFRNFLALALQGFKEPPQSSRLFEFSCRFVQQHQMSGTIIGGNLRCLLKLAGTPCFPDPRGRLLFLEARSGSENRILTYYSQLQQMGIFDQVSGVLLGTFTQLMQEESSPDPQVRLLLPFIPKALPVAVTSGIGHGPDARALLIGGTYCLRDD